MYRKQNRDPNRSTQTVANHIQKKQLTQHNNSLNTISSTQQYAPASKKPNKNSQILAEIKQSKNLISSKHQKQPHVKQSLSTTRNNYKPRFILKDLMEDKQASSHNESESRCDEYLIENHHEQNNMSNTFNNSPLASEAYYKFNGKPTKGQLLRQQNVEARNKSVNLTKRNYLEDESKRFEEQESTIQYDLPLQAKKCAKNVRRTEEHLEGEENVPQLYEEQSTVQYSQKYAKRSILQPSAALSFEPRIRSVSTSQLGQGGTSNSPRNYKMSYLETKKKLEIRQAYFNEAMQLCRHIFGGMKQALQEQYCQNESERVMWCHQRCQEMMRVFDEWNQE